MSDASKQRHQRPLSRDDRRFPTRTRQGLTPDAIAELHAHQGGKCPICRKPLGRRFVVEHDHLLAAAHGHNPKVGCPHCVRGLTDYRCNRLLALADDDAELLRRASVYVGWRRQRAAS